MDIFSKICDAYMALGARGISLLFASGDVLYSWCLSVLTALTPTQGGIRGNHDSLSECDSTSALAVFPASCPYVTTVGATTGLGPETAASFSGGGFSSFFAAPSYQSDAVVGFLETLPTDFEITFNHTGRGYPDVSLQGVNFQVVVDGSTQSIGGTSASTPTFASVIALINDRLIAAGKPVLGFLNPFLYSATAGLTDITAGHGSGDSCPASSVSQRAMR
jgi:tripeptidyl-peptidase-1